MATRRGPTSQVPIDLVLVAVLALWTLVVAGGQSTAGQILLGLVAVLFAPGYALGATLFPGKQSSMAVLGRGDTIETERETITPVERLVLSIGLSVCVVPLVGVGLDYTPWGISTTSLLGVIGATTLVLTGIGAVRRWRLPPDDRFDPRVFAPPRDVVARVRAGPGNSTVTLLLVVGLVIAGSGIGVALLGAERGEQFTEFYLVTEESDGEFVANEYPDEIRQGTAENVSVGVANQEGVTTDYTVVVVLQSLDSGGEIRNVQTLDTFTVTVPDGETVTESRAIRPETTGENLRVTYLLYRGAPPENDTPSVDNAYRDVHIWIDVPPAE